MPAIVCLTTIALGGNLCNEKYFKDVKCMTEYFIKIIEENKPLLFPIQIFTPLLKKILPKTNDLHSLVCPED